MSVVDRELSFERRDELVSRVIDGEASEVDWSALRSLAEADPSVWGEIATAQRQHEALCSVVEEACRSSERVEIAEGGLLTPTERFERRMGAVRAWGGWAAAAAVVLVWFTGLPSPAMGPTAGLAPAGELVAELAPDEALARYLERGRQTGRVLAEVPERVVVETRPLAAGGGVEVVYLRQILEREVVAPSRVYRLGRNEFGESTWLPGRVDAPGRVSY